MINDNMGISMMDAIEELGTTVVHRVNMSSKNPLNDLLENGYILLENVIDTSLLANIKQCICEKLVKLGAPSEFHFSDQYKYLSKNIHPYEINRLLMREIVCA